MNSGAGGRLARFYKTNQVDWKVLFPLGPRSWETLARLIPKRSASSARFFTAPVAIIANISSTRRPLKTFTLKPGSDVGSGSIWSFHGPNSNCLDCCKCLIFQAPSSINPMAAAWVTCGALLGSRNYADDQLTENPEYESARGSCVYGWICKGLGMGWVGRECHRPSKRTRVFVPKDAPSSSSWSCSARKQVFSISVSSSNRSVGSDCRRSPEPI